MQVSALLENMIYSFVNKEFVFPNGFEIDIEDGKVVCVRKLASVRTITEKGERPQDAATTQQKTQPKGARDTAHSGDLSRRGFTVTTN